MMVISKTTVNNDSEEKETSDEELNKWPIGTKIFTND